MRASIKPIQKYITSHHESEALDSIPISSEKKIDQQIVENFVHGDLKRENGLIVPGANTKDSYPQEVYQ